MTHEDSGDARNVVGMTRLTTLTCCLTVAGAVALGAQSSETTTTTKIEIKDGKDIKVTGCVEAGLDGGYMLTHVDSKRGALHRYVLVSDEDDFSKVVGQRVEIEGKAADIDRGRVEIKTETKVEGPAKDTHSTVHDSGAYLGVKHMKTIAASCP
jgi:hypothetical protein